MEQAPRPFPLRPLTAVWIAALLIMLAVDSLWASICAIIGACVVSGLVLLSATATDDAEDDARCGGCENCDCGDSCGCDSACCASCCDCDCHGDDGEDREDDETP